MRKIREKEMVEEKTKSLVGLIEKLLCFSMDLGWLPNANQNRANKVKKQLIDGNAYAQLTMQLNFGYKIYFDFDDKDKDIIKW